MNMNEQMKDCVTLAHDMCDPKDVHHVVMRGAYTAEVYYECNMRKRDTHYNYVDAYHYFMPAGCWGWNIPMPA
ncbi:MAG: hypothetical protein ACYSUC_12820 [Planctomycetota bacterium]|jgi:hypothetical protein